jgi:predicted Zn-dependent protease
VAARARAPIKDDPVMATVVRASIVVLAITACVWFALAARAARDVDRANAIVSTTAPLTAAQAAHARSLLDAAGTLNPDTAVDLLEAKVALGRNDYRGAVRTILDVTKREPLNIQAWVALARVAFHRNPRLVLLAVENIGRLDARVK